MVSRTARCAAALAAVGLAALALPAAAHAQSGYCSPTGDFCTAVVRQGDDAIFRIGTFAFGGRYRLCVTAPDRSRRCKRFRLRPQGGGVLGSRVRWSRHFPGKGRGLYRVRWRKFGNNLGPRLSFRRGPSMHLRPATVRAGGTVRVFGLTGGCAPGNSVVLLSGAFPRDDEFAGVPAVFTPVGRDDRYGTRIRIPPRRRPGTYQVSARCGGGNMGLFRRLRVTR
jgi:hypothetical protein